MQIDEKIVFEKRASVILYRYLCSSKVKGTYLIPANICPIVPITFLKAGIKFEFVDIKPDTLCIDEELLIARITGQRVKYNGIIFNHSFGVNYLPLKLFSELKGISPELNIIDDRCLCKPKLDNFTDKSDLIDLILYSTGYGKYADIGFGGFGLLKNTNNIKDCSLEFDQRHLDHLESGWKYAIKTHSNFTYKDSKWLDCQKPPLEFAEYIDKVNTMVMQVEEHKRRLNYIYKTNIDYELQYPAEYQNWRFNIKVPRKDKLITKIFSNNLFASSLYESLGEGIFSKNHFPVAYKTHFDTINLFNDFNFTEEQAFLICRLINEHLCENR